MRTWPLIIWSLAFLSLVAGFGAGVWWLSYREALARLEDQGRADLAFAADRLSAQLLRYRELAVVLTAHPDLRGLVFEGGDGARDRGGDGAAGDALVRAMADKTGALSIELVDAGGRVRASSWPVSDRLNPAENPLSRALDGALGTTHGMALRGNGEQARVFSFAAPIFAPQGPAVGAIVAEVDVRGIEENWPGNAPAAFFFDGAGRVFVSNRSELVLSRLGTPGGILAPITPSEAAQTVQLPDGGPYLPRSALHIERPLPAIGLTAGVLLDTAPVARGAAQRAAAVMALMLVFGAALLVALQQRRALDGRLAVEAAANARLESHVADRTHALSSANIELRREIAERKEAEAALKRAQDELVQAGKLSALGKMSAGISHELNQPLMAIRSFAENGEAFFERDQPDKARANLGRIAELSRRMGRIIQNLRAFARQESGPVSDVDLARVVDDALEVTSDKIAHHGVHIGWAHPGAAVIVRGGEVRLQQVVVNLLSNAVDALEGVAPPAPRRIDIALSQTGPIVRLTVADSGPGLSEPERVFDPFYSTKAVGAADGMGLGLSISYGLVHSFGGTIRGANQPGGGAVFVVELISADKAAVA